MQVIKSTGFFRGLYTPQELDAKSIQVCITHRDMLHVYMYVHVCTCLYTGYGAIGCVSYYEQSAFSVGQGFQGCILAEGIGHTL